MDPTPGERSDFEPDTSLADLFQVIEQGPEPEPDDTPAPENDPDLPPIEDIEEFENDVAQEFVGLMNLGKLRGTYDVFGHTVVMRTLRTGEELAIAKIISDYQGTIAAGKAYQTACVASSVESVDGKSMDQVQRSLGPSDDAQLENRFLWFLSNWDWSVIEDAYDGFRQLEERKMKIVEWLRSKSTASRTTSTS